MNSTERIEEMALVAEACGLVSENTQEMAELSSVEGADRMLLVGQAQILAAPAVILRNIGLNLARETGGHSIDV